MTTATTTRIDLTKLDAYDQLTMSLSNAQAVLSTLHVATQAEDLSPEVLAGTVAAVQLLIKQAQEAARQLT